jgi:hypothetical protein
VHLRISDDALAHLGAARLELRLRGRAPPNRAARAPAGAAPSSR